MQQIEIDFDVWKELTLRRSSENVTYNDVLREMLGLEATFGRQLEVALSGKKPNGFIFRGLFLPEGTKLRAQYKGGLYLAEIRNGRWLDESGAEHTSPSAAATSVTGNNVNGWRFWEARRPQDSEWRKIDALPKSPS